MKSAHSPKARGFENPFLLLNPQLDNLEDLPLFFEMVITTLRVIRPEPSWRFYLLNCEKETVIEYFGNRTTRERRNHGLRAFHFRAVLILHLHRNIRSK